MLPSVSNLPAPPSQPRLVVTDVYQLGYSGLFGVCLSRRYYNGEIHIEHFTCCKSIAAIYYCIYAEQQAAQRRERSLMNRLTDPDDIGAVDLEGLEVADILKLTAIVFVAVIVLFALFMWLGAVVPPLFNF